MTTLQSREDALLRRVRAFDWARLKWCFAATALCMLLAHGFAWFNLFPSHDGTILVFDADVVMLQLGRWVELLYFRFVRGRINAPWLNGAFTIVWTSLAVYLVGKLLQLGKKATIALCAVFSTAISVTLLYATYYDKTDLYACAMFLAVWGVYAVRRFRCRWWGVLFCGGCLCLAMGLYQGYIEFAIGLFLICLLRDCLTEDLAWAEYLRHGVTAVVSLLLGGVLYAVSLKVVLAYKHLELIDSSNGLQQMSRAGVADYLARLPGAYKQVFTTLLGYDVWNNRGMRLATAVCLLLGLACPADETEYTLPLTEETVVKGNGTEVSVDTNAKTATITYDGAYPDAFLNMPGDLSDTKFSSIIIKYDRLTEKDSFGYASRYTDNKSTDVNIKWATVSGAFAPDAHEVEIPLDKTKDLYQFKIFGNACDSAGFIIKAVILKK